MIFQFPKPDQRVFVSGRTGSGKTVFGIWLLSKSTIDKKPWFIFDYKLDKHLGEIHNSHIFELHERIPKYPGLYHIQPEEIIDDDEVVELLYKIKRHGDIGVYFDEGYSIPQTPGKTSFRGLMTQGRSLGIPIITLTQRPVWIDKFAISEADYYAVFHLNQKADRKRVEELLPSEVNGKIDMERMLDTYCCHWYDVNRNWFCKLGPVPPPEESVRVIDARLKPRKHWL